MTTLLHRLKPFACAALLAAPLALTSCSDTPADPGTDPPVVEEPAGPVETAEVARQEADPADAVRRARERWQLIEAGDWIQVYDFVPKLVRARQSLQMFLGEKEFHHYENPGQPKLVWGDDRNAYVEVSVLWTPTHPQIITAPNYDEMEFPQELTMIEEWRVEDGEWFHFQSQRPDEFFESHPEVLETIRGGKDE